MSWLLQLLKTYFS